ncbi:MAG: hypothetical protein Q8P56_04760 [Candidatus Uhrbacteria bacterium]|nr:hypothetical protein [Candidatus Uhrbacteria bacterium]
MWFQLVVEQMQAELTAADPVPGGSVVGSEEEVVGEACEDVRRLSNLGRRISESIRL